MGKIEIIEFSKSVKKFSYLKRQLLSNPSYNNAINFFDIELIEMEDNTDPSGIIFSIKTYERTLGTELTVKNKFKFYFCRYRTFFIYQKHKYILNCADIEDLKINTEFEDFAIDVETINEGDNFNIKMYYSAYVKKD